MSPRVRMPGAGAVVSTLIGIVGVDASFPATSKTLAEMS